MSSMKGVDIEFHRFPVLLLKSIGVNDHLKDKRPHAYPTIGPKCHPPTINCQAQPKFIHQF